MDKLLRNDDVGGKIQYKEILEQKSGKLKPGLKFGSENQAALRKYS